MHGAPHATDRFLDDSQTDTCPLVLLLGMETLKYLENLLNSSVGRCQGHYRARTTRNRALLPDASRVRYVCVRHG